MLLKPHVVLLLDQNIPLHSLPFSWSYHRFLLFGLGITLPQSVATRDLDFRIFDVELI